MILDKLENGKLYYAMHPKFKKAFAFLKKLDMSGLQAGRIEIDGDQLFAIVVDDNGKGQDNAKPETHNKYIDIQYQVSGSDNMGVEARESMRGLGYDAERDLEFYDGKTRMWINTAPGHFAIFFPSDIHAPMGGTGRQVKVVVKVKA
jgi:biofilm protein TabA